MISHPLPQHAPVVARTVRPVLIAVHNACEEIVAGLGSALFSVRTLDGLSCDVRAGELLLLVGGVASGATSLLAAMHGSPSRVRAARHVTAGVQLRRATIPFSASEAIMTGWRAAQVEPPEPIDGAAAVAEGRAPVVYLLRVRPDDVTRANSTGVNTTHSWRAWAAALRARGGAVVLARADNASEHVRGREKRTTDRGALSEVAMVRETNECGRGWIRTITVHAGRIVSADRQWSGG